MIRKKSVGVEEVRPAEGVEQGLFLGIGDFKFVIAPPFDSLDSSAHFSPLRSHPLLMFFPGIELEQMVECRLRRVRLDTGQYLRRGSGPSIKLRIRRLDRRNRTIAGQERAKND